MAAVGASAPGRVGPWAAANQSSAMLHKPAANQNARRFRLWGRVGLPAEAGFAACASFAAILPLLPQNYDQTSFLASRVRPVFVQPVFYHGGSLDISAYLDTVIKYPANAILVYRIFEKDGSMNIGRKIRAQLPEFYATVERLRGLAPLFVSVTYGAGGARQQNTLTVTTELARRGLTAMAHLTCVGAEAASIAAFVAALRAAGVDNVLALRGDPPARQAGDQPWDWSRARFRHAADLVAFVREREPGMGIGVAAYPAPHPESPSFAEDRRRTAEKLRAGADFALSQLFFDAREYEDLVAHLRAQGIAIPIVPGILPIQSFDSLRRVLSLCGANIPGKLYLDLEAADARGGAQAVRDVGLDFAVRQIRRLLDSGAPGIHLYTLNKAELCLRLAQEAGLACGQPCATRS